jgi:Icc-related predicted phosphoesterase
MIITAISDVHNQIGKLELRPANMLIIGGDLTGRGTVNELIKFNADLNNIKPLFKHVVVIAGNHDFLFQNDYHLAKSLISNVTHYLQDDLIEIEGLRIYGSPHQPSYGGWAFNLDRGPAIKAKWDLIPNDLDILITHGPPMGILDKDLGCKDLLDAVIVKKPKIHIFGHIHEGYGVKVLNNTTFINASSCDEAYCVTNEPITFEVLK